MRAFLLLIAGLLAVRRLLLPSGRQAQPPQPTGEPAPMVRDPICRVFVPVRTALSARRDGETVYFCSTTCRARYLQAS